MPQAPPIIIPCTMKTVYPTPSRNYKQSCEGVAKVLMGQSQNLKARNTFVRRSLSAPAAIRWRRGVPAGAPEESSSIRLLQPSRGCIHSHLQCPADSKHRSEELSSQALLPLGRYSLLAGLGSTGDNSTRSASEIPRDPSSLYSRRSCIFIMPARGN